MIKRFPQYHHHKLIQNQIQFQIEATQIATIIDVCKQFAIAIKFQAGYYYIKNDDHNHFKKWLNQQDQELLAKIFFNHREQILVFQPHYHPIINDLWK